MWPHLLAVGIVYLLGAVPFGFLIVKLFHGADVRAAGYGSTGATNVVRSAGIKAGALTYILDVAKGAGAVLLMVRPMATSPFALGIFLAASVLLIRTRAGAGWMLLAGAAVGLLYAHFA